MKKLLTLLIPLCVFISCEDEAEEAAGCADTLANMEANMDAASAKFENEPNKTNCDAIVYPKFRFFSRGAYISRVTAVKHPDIPVKSAPVSIPEQVLSR